MNLQQLLFNPSGGVGYQFRALLNKKHWRPFRHFVSQWLMDWARDFSPQNLNQLVLVGPNAGHTLPASFISLFTRVIVVEPDPVAYVLFESRFLLRSHWIRHDYFSIKAKKPNPNELKNLFALYPHATFLFCNVLGQLPVLLRDKKLDSHLSVDRKVDVEAYMRDLSEVLRAAFQTHKVASYHDRYSRNLRKSNEIVDHLTGDLFSFVSDKKETPWRISSQEEHQIEFVRN